MIKKEADKILKYKNFTTETERIWNVKPTVLLVLILKRGTISQSLRQYLSNLQGQHDINELKKKEPHWALHT